MMLPVNPRQDQTELLNVRVSLGVLDAWEEHREHGMDR
jgi:hypothetical protein